MNLKINSWHAGSVRNLLHISIKTTPTAEALQTSLWYYLASISRIRIDFSSCSLGWVAMVQRKL